MSMTEPYAQSPERDKTDLNPHWIESLLPPPLRAYAYLMRLDRPIGTWLLLLPGLWSIALATASTENWGKALWLSALFAIGSIVMRGAGCIVNDLWDRDFDALVARTKTRPLVAGTVTPYQAKVAILILGLIGLIILIQMNISTILLGILSIPFILVYPFMKRITWWPQFFLGLTFNFGALMGWTAVTNELSAAPLLLYAAGIFWTLGYDTIYAHMDKDDDALIGVRSSARALGGFTTIALCGFYTLTTILFYMSASSIGHSLALYIGTLIIAAGFIWQISKIDIENPQQCLRLFRFNRDQGLIILLACVLHALSVG